MVPPYIQRLSISVSGTNEVLGLQIFCPGWSAFDVDNLAILAECIHAFGNKFPGIELRRLNAVLALKRGIIGGKKSEIYVFT